MPGIISFALFAITVELTLIAFISERTSGTLQRLLVSPLRESEIVSGYAMAFSVIGTIQATLLLVVAIAAFHITVAGNFFIALGVIILLAIVLQSLGILISSISKREIQVNQFMPILILSVFILCGVVWPLKASQIGYYPYHTFFLPHMRLVPYVRYFERVGFGQNLVRYRRISIIWCSFSSVGNVGTKKKKCISARKSKCLCKLVK